MLTVINNSWKWKGVEAIEVVKTNDFGNVIFKTNKGEYWRICPEELSCEKIADNEAEYIQISKEADFISDWEMENIIDLALSEFSTLKDGEKFCLKVPGIIGGKYEKENIGKINFTELIKHTADLSFQIKDLKEGDFVELRIID